MKNSKIKIIMISVLTSALCACSFFDKDNTPAPAPLVAFKPEARVYSLWYAMPNAGVENTNIKLVPAVTPQRIFTADKNGSVTASSRSQGKTLWRNNTKLPISAGASANEGLVVVGTHAGEVIALRQVDGGFLWRNRVASEILACPAIGNGVVLVKSIDGQLTALSVRDGHTLWHYQQTEPTLILRGASTPRIHNETAIVGFASGNLGKFTLREGSLLWLQTIATPEGMFAIQRMVDIDADPIIFNNRIYVATYQGKVAALDLRTGREIWTHDISSYIGIAVDNQRVYVSDAKGHIWAFNAHTGNVDWRQPQLTARNITGPATIQNYIVVGDGEGYLHWLNKTDGRFIARTKVDRSGMVAAPVVDNNVTYVVTKEGRLVAYTITS